MSKHRVVVLKIVGKQLTVTEAAELYGISRRQLQRLLARYREGGIEAVDPQSRRPKSNPRSTPPEVVERILSEHHIDPTRGYWRNQLTSPGRWPQKRQMSRDT